MKIMTADGRAQTIPFSLGQDGRGRKLEEVRVSRTSGHIPDDPSDVGYVCHGEGENAHVLLKRPDGSQRGILLRVNTKGVYTNRSCGSVELLGGKATLLTEGAWAEGAAGNSGGGPDQLWHVEGPCLFRVVIQGGEHKGYGLRYVIVTEAMKPVMIRPADLCQMIATDDDPAVTKVVRMFPNDLPEDVQSAVQLAERLEDAMDVPQTEVVHFATPRRSIEEAITTWGLAIPAAMGKKATGVGGVEADTLLPGTGILVDLAKGPGGGKRYSLEEYSEVGVTRLREACERPFNHRSILGLVEPGWYSAWIEYKDREVTSYVIANAGGVHSFAPVSDGWNDQLRTQAWEGHPAAPLAEADFRLVFQLAGTTPAAASPAPTAAAPAPSAPAAMDPNNPFAVLGRGRGGSSQW